MLILSVFAFRFLTASVSDCQLGYLGNDMGEPFHQGINQHSHIQTYCTVNKCHSSGTCKSLKIEQIYVFFFLTQQRKHPYVTRFPKKTSELFKHTYVCLHSSLNGINEIQPYRSVFTSNIFWKFAQIFVCLLPTPTHLNSFLCFNKECKPNGVRALSSTYL